MVAPPVSVVPPSGLAADEWELDLASQLKRTVPHRLAAVTKDPPGWVQLEKSQMGTGVHCAPWAPL